MEGLLFLGVISVIVLSISYGLYHVSGDAAHFKRGQEMIRIKRERLAREYEFIADRFCNKL